MKFDFTNGKWEVCAYDYKERYVECNNKLICQFHNGDDMWEEFENHEANAQLISCAPEMIKALIESTLKIEKDLYNWDYDADSFYINMEKLYEKNISIIEKATGKKWSEII